MTVAELQAALQAAVDRGLPPETTVVLQTSDWEYCVAEFVADPSVPGSECDLWFTLGYGDVADHRSTP